MVQSRTRSHATMGTRFEILIDKKKNLKVKDEDDYEVNYLIDRNMAVSFAIINRLQTEEIGKRARKTKTNPFKANRQFFCSSNN